ncbi:MAG: malate dehydrogenase [Candidatus Hydrothermarchaeaceae archaeon]
MKITVVGAGNIGSTASLLIAERGLCDELVVLDIASDKVAGVALDLGHCSSVHGDIEVVGTTDYSASVDSDLVVIAAGIPRMPGESRLDLTKKNAGIMRGVIRNLARYTGGTYLVVSNPVDVLTYIALKESGMPPQRVFGLGTMLDTLRLRSLMPGNVDASKVLVVGEHGDSMVPVFSGVAGGRASMMKFFEEVRYGAAQVIKLRGFTAFAPAVAIAEVVGSIAMDEGKGLPVSVYHEEHDLCISTLAKVDRKGATRMHLKLNKKEEEDFLKSVKVIDEALAESGYRG